MYVFNVVDIKADKTVLRGVTPQEIAKYMGVPRVDVNIYAATDALYRNRYKFYFAQEDKPTKSMNNMDTDKFAQEWREMQKLFKGIKWVKRWEEGVKVNE